MELRRIIAAAASAAITLSMGGCSLGDKVNEFIENDANIGKNKPAVGTIADGSQIQLVTAAAEETAAETEAALSVSEKYLILADEIMEQMSTEQKIGQLILARMPLDDEAAVNDMYQYQFGGYTMYADNFKNGTAETVYALNCDVKNAAAVTPFIAVDEEGGTVVRVSKYSQYRSEPFSSPQLLFQRGGADLLEVDAEEKALLLLSLGININLAPVADITMDESAYIYPRTLGQNTEDTAEGVAAIVRASNRKNMASCLKHFPGYGSNSDTHTGSSHDDRALYELKNTDFVPFIAGITADEDKTPAVMVNHGIYESIDPELPASISTKAHDILREELSFEGVIITDDMGMDAIAQYSGETSPYVMGVLAGNDMLCVSDYKTAYSDITDAYAAGVITDDMLSEHVRRSLVMKLQYGIIDEYRQPVLPSETEASEETEE